MGWPLSSRSWVPALGALLIALATVAEPSPSVRARLSGVDARRSLLQVDGPQGRVTWLVAPEARLMATDGTPLRLDGLVPGDDVRAAFDEQGRVRALELIREPRPEATAPPPREWPRTNPTAPNPSAPEPRNDRAPGDVPGNRIPW